MAITKILSLNMSKTGDSASHLLNSLHYIVDVEKTEEHALVGSINCLPIADLAYKQMVETKKFFGKQTGRQGYQIIISFEKGETTPDVAFQIAGEFTEQYLKNQYECLYAVHDDKEHCHIHIVFNSVNLETGRKFSYKKGDWKHVMQPITNRLCEKYDLNIMPAEYSTEKTNLPRDIYNQQQEYRELIKEDCEYVLSIAEDVKHFIWLLREMGYSVKEGKHIAVTIPGMKRYARIDSIDKRFSREGIESGVNRGCRILHFGYLTEPVVYKKTTGPFTLITCYRKQLRGRRAADVHRFKYHSAYLYKQIKIFYRLQEEYLFMVDHKLETAEDVLKCGRAFLDEIKHIEDCQKKIYRENAALKRKCKSIEDVPSYQRKHYDNEKQLKELSARKKDLKHQYDLLVRIYCRSDENDFEPEFNRIADEWDGKEIEASQEELLAEVPEYPPHKERREAAEKAAKEKAAKEAAEKAAKEKAAREAAEKAAREKAEQEAREKSEKLAQDLIASYQADEEVLYDGDAKTVSMGYGAEGFDRYYSVSGSEGQQSDNREIESFLADQKAKRASAGRRGRDKEAERQNRELERQRQGIEGSEPVKERSQERSGRAR